MGASERDALPAEIEQAIEKIERKRVHVEREDKRNPLSPILYVACPPDPKGAWVRYTDLHQLALEALALGREQGRQEERARCVSLANRITTSYARGREARDGALGVAAAIEGREGAGR